MQIARDKEGTLRLFDNIPVKHEEGYWTSQRGYNDIELDSHLFPEVTWENSPKEVEFKFSTTGADRGRRDSIIRGLKQLEEDYMLSYEEEIEWLNQIVKDYNPKKVEIVEEDLVEKACKWLDDNLYTTYDMFNNVGIDSVDSCTVEEFIESFRKFLKINSI